MLFFFFNDTATTEIYTLSLHDALPIYIAHLQVVHPVDVPRFAALDVTANLQALWAVHEPQMDELTIPFLGAERSEEHTSELQSRQYLVCRLLLEKKKITPSHVHVLLHF